MADESQTQHTIRSIHWREVFPFLNIFRAFRVAVHPSKLVLGLVALLVLYTGGRILDGLWSLSKDALPNYGEVDEYEKHIRLRSTASFSDSIDETRRNNRDQYAKELLDAGVFEKEDAAKRSELAKKAAESFDHQGELSGKIYTARDDLLRAENERYGKEKDEIGKGKPEDKGRLLREARTRHAESIRNTFAVTDRQLEGLKQRVPRGVFAEFFEYEVRQVNKVVAGVISNNWAGGMGEGEVGNTGVLRATLNFLTVGPAWFVLYHFWYFVLFAALFLLVWAVFGGAIARIAAVHVARDEKISVRQALKFSTNKVLSFVFAPIIPLLIVLAIGAVLAAGGLLFYLPWGIGPVLASLAFVFALVAGVVITLVLLGTGGGFNLMYPTVAVEGSDSFDAISRSFSYVFARPWRMLWYTVVAVAYGALTYLFVRFFIYLVLAVTHVFVGWWLFRGTQPNQWYTQIWPTPSFAELPYNVNLGGLGWAEWFSALVISFWNYMLIGLLGAFAISFYFSANTIIYYLMRREVDATELDDVYVEETDDDLADAPIAATTTPAAGLSVTPVAATSAPGGGVSGTAGSATSSGEAKAYAGPQTETPPSSTDGGTPPPT